MPMQKASFHVPLSVFKKHIDIHDPELVSKYQQRNKDMEAKYNREAIDSRIKLYRRKSLWEGAPLTFTIADWQPQQRKDEQQARSLGNQAVKLARQMVNQPFNVVMLGEAGVGKTSLAMMMASILEQHNKTVMFVSVNELRDLNNDQFDFPEVKLKLKDRLQFISNADVLILDDLGSEAGNFENDGKISPSFQRLIYSIARSRYEGTKADQKKSVMKEYRLPHPVRSAIITTNNTQEQLEKIYGERTTSRLITMNKDHRLAFNGMEDMRQKSNL